MTGWPDIECEVCGELVGDDGLRVRYERLLVPVSVSTPEFHGWCSTHRPETVEKEEDLLEELRYGPRETWLEIIRNGIRRRPEMYLDNDNHLIGMPDGLSVEEQEELRNLAIDAVPGGSRQK